jgi:hypothetical protein
MAASDVHEIRRDTSEGGQSLIIRHKPGPGSTRTDWFLGAHSFAQAVQQANPDVRIVGFERQTGELIEV